MQKPILYVFLISHYCEKARWALDYCGVDYQVKLLSPLVHAKTVKQAGAHSSGLPVLKTPDGVIQGSADIVAWASAQAIDNGKEGLLITPESLEIEKRLDDVLGIHVRRWFFSESMIDCPEIVKPVFSSGASFFGRMTLSLAWGKVVETMIKRMDLGADQEIESRTIVEYELTWLDSMLEDGRDFLIGDSLSNADIAAASLVAPMFGPPKHPASDILRLPPRVSDFVEQLRPRPFAKWFLKQYQENR